jgi:drug/metabolite transporter (DMT)-like permease
MKFWRIFSKNRTISQTKGVVAALLSAVAFGSLGLFAVHLMKSGLSVLSILNLRFALAALFLSLCVPFLTATSEKPAWKDRLINMLYGAIGYGLSAFLFFLAIQKTSSGLANILLFQNPLVVFLLTCFFHKMKTTKIHILAIALYAFGIFLVFWKENSFSFSPFGVGMGIASAIWYGIYLFLTEKRSKQFHSLWLTTDVLIGSAVATSLVAALTHHFVIPTQASLLLCAVALAFFCTVIPVLLLLYAMKRIGSRDATILSALEPVMTVFLGSLFLQESWLPQQMVGSWILILCVLLIVTQGQNKSYSS